MARYDIDRAWFRTPRGHAVLMHIREGTNDWNTCFAAMNEDEYGLRDLHLTGHAIDIGGHLGAVTISLLVDNPELTVDVVEPLPENLDLIRQNAKVNGVEDRLTILDAAAGDGDPVTIYYGFTDNENDLHHAFIGNSGNPDFRGRGDASHRSVTVPTFTASDLPDASFVKIDCEGGEWGFFANGDASGFDLIAGEWHNVLGHTRDDLPPLLPGHDITFTGPEAGPGGFRATRRGL